LHTLSGPNEAACLRRLQIEQDNVRAALEWGLSSPALGEQAVELAGALFWFWTKRGFFAEGRQWLERAAAVPAPRVLRARVALGLGHMDYFQGRHADMMIRNDEALMWAREAGDAWLVSRLLFGHGLAKFECGAFDDAAALAVAAREAAGDEVFSPPLLILGNIALVNGDHDRALALFEEAIDGLRRAREIWGLGILLSLAAGLRTLREEFDGARAYASEALSIDRELEDPRGIAWSLDVFAGLIATEGHAAEAARLWGASDRLLATVGGTLVPTIGWIRDRYFAPARAALGEHAFEAARAEGRAMQPERAIALATRRFDLIVGTEHRHRSAPL
jgi:non-specific serine/threonine protein kinase